MANLIIKFEGMSLLVGDRMRSEVFLISTSGGEIPHSHRHTVGLPGESIKADGGVLMWVEESGRRLEGPILYGREPLIGLDEICKGDRLKEQFTTAVPDRDTLWRSDLAAWFRLPGGVVETEDTPGPGGQSIWEFPEHAGRPAKRQKLTQLASLTRPVEGSIALVLRDMDANRDTRHPVDPDKAGNFTVTVTTAFDGPEALPPPSSGRRVDLTEVKLLYRCLDPGDGAIPFAIWPTNPPKGPLQTFSDPVTGICPIGSKRL
jgi:hypothetical protein